MTDWLSHAVSLSDARDQAQLADRYTSALCQEIALSQVWVIQPCEHGRKLSVIGHNQALDWLVDDFSHPFAHVLRSPSHMLMDEQRLLYWQANKAFSTLISARRSGEGVLIAPLPVGGSKVKALVVLMGPQALLGELLTDSSWQQFSELYISRWQVVADMGAEASEKSALSASIEIIRRDTRKRELSVELQNQLVGNSRVMDEMRAKVVTAAQSELSVLIQGDTGTGKELVARAVHELSTRKTKPFIAINCAAIPENLLESELFGHLKGAFSGAERGKKGLLTEADGGTLFLDEIGDMPLALQAKLLRAVETRSFRPVGGKNEESADFRLVAATHVALREKAHSGLFRKDFYYRLNQFPINVPPLCERKEDIPELTRHFIAENNRRGTSNVTGIRSGAIELLGNYDFPGNVRELRNLVEYACALTGDGEEVCTQGFAGRGLHAARSVALSSSSELGPNGDGVSDTCAVTDLKEAVLHFESRIIRSRLAHFDGDRAKTAQSLGLPKRTLAHKCLKLEIV